MIYTGYVVEESRKRIIVHRGVFESAAEAMEWSHNYDTSETKIWEAEE